ncbi:MAG: hypothetical protein KatS3mg131_3889 [Candidatus Tectimicrobiota bacterium]|nr:MAG: hypothetical protein KatS3mg131_3889 [Candidatus Tectomicrobia bacterium]
MPLLVKGRVTGALGVGDAAGRTFTPEEMRLAVAFANQAALALEQARLYARLQRTGDFLLSVIDHSADAILTTDLHGRITFCSPSAAELFGCRCEELVGQAMAAFYRGGRAEAEGVMRRLRAEGTLRDYETVLRTRDGREVEVSASISLLRNLKGEVTGTLGILKDISARKRLEAQLRQAQKMEAIGTLAGGIAHDFNNILAAIMGYAELAQQDVPEQSPPWHHLQEVLRGCQRARDLIRQILAFSRQGEAERRPVALHQLCRETLRLLRAALPATVTLREHLEEGTVLADPTQLQQVLLNLGSNAGHAMREGGGELEVRLETVQVEAPLAATHPALHPGPYLCLTVRDTGTGMPPQVLERIFDPFFTTKAPGEGTGLGLATVHRIVSDHGGAILVESTPGRGTTFRVYLPRHEGTAASEAAPAALSGGQERVLFVDDEQALAALGGELLSRLGYQVVVCSDSRAALEVFRAQPQRFDVVVTDQTMPHLTGEALARELRRLRPDIPLILCTGLGFERAEDADAVLLKPYSAADLAQAIRRALAARRPAGSAAG